MGYIVPPPPVNWPVVVKDVAIGLRALTPWLCLYCHTIQVGGRVDCCNCGAPRLGIDETAEWVADAAARANRIRRLHVFDSRTSAAEIDAYKAALEGPLSAP